MAASDSARPKFRRRAADRPDELLDAALTLFVEKGYAHTCVAEIARAAGLSKGAVYLYFPSKQSILEGLVKRAVAPVAAHVLAAADLAAGNIRDTLRTILTIVATALGDPKVFAVPRIVLREAAVAPEIAEMYRRAVFDTVFPAATRMIEQAIESGQMRPVDPELTIRSLIGPILAHLLLAEVFGVHPTDGLALDRLVENHLDILINGLIPAPEPCHD
ncbi:MAG: TetR family transcriptional regulator [Rhodobacterales bacterium CG2_30_65_12]|nr:MAG: TetR family transcriptional regulator [Rhodobacterales bacterium CG2_30_65_12]